MQKVLLLKYLFLFLSAFVVTYLLTPVLREFAKVSGMVDMPDKRRINKKPVARSGGIAVFIGFHVSCAAGLWLSQDILDVERTMLWWWNSFMVSSILLAVGIADDYRSLNPWFKLAGQTVSALLAYTLGMRVGTVLGIDLPMALDLIATVLWFLAIINAFNLIDGMDGLASGLAAIAALGIGGALLFRHTPTDALVTFALVGACLAFLKYNFYPASVFLGDAGSMFLGFMLAAISLNTGSKDAAVASIGVPILALGIPIIDTALAIWRRSMRKFSSKGKSGIFQPDMEHLHHRLIKAGSSQAVASTRLYAVGIILVGIGLLALVYQSQAVGIYLLAFVAAVYIVVRHVARVELWDSGVAILSGKRRSRTKILAVLLYLPLDIILLSVALALTTFLLNPSLSLSETRIAWAVSLPVWVGIPFLGICSSRSYIRVWSRGRISEYVILGFSVFGGIVLAAGLSLLDENCAERLLMLKSVIYAGMAVPLVTGIRAFSSAVRDAMSWSKRHQSIAHGSSLRNILVSGAGDRCILFLREMNLDSPDNIEVRHVAGILDNDRNLHGRYVYGYRVLGGINKLPEIIKKHNIHEIVLTQSLPDEAMETLLKDAKENNVVVSEWKTALNVLQS